MLMKLTLILAQLMLVLECRIHSRTQLYRAGSVWVKQVYTHMDVEHMNSYNNTFNMRV